MSETNEVIRVERLECRYDGRVVLRDINFSVQRNEIFFVAGRSGCGKSTLLRHLLGLQVPAGGRIAYFGKEFSDPLSRREIFKSFGVLFQEDALWTEMSLRENIALPLLLHTRLSRRTRAEIVGLKLAQVGLAGHAESLPSELSGGMRKRAALARALALDPAILFFDEPTSGLDPITARQINDLILHVRHTVGATVVVVSHSISSIMAIADRMILLDAKRKGIIAEGRPADVARSHEDPLVREFFRREGSNRGKETLPAAAGQGTAAA
ncbi:MAG TPA: ATP-binding cassette domain-containing protein [Verrucomicrobiae bacterium]|nr:ATP-binding cassette domain-containing protein [Verrucomicrobiae bacterium]